MRLSKFLFVGKTPPIPVHFIKYDDGDAGLFAEDIGFYIPLTSFPTSSSRWAGGRGWGGGGIVCHLDMH